MFEKSLIFAVRHEEEVMFAFEETEERATAPTELVGSVCLLDISRETNEF